MDEKLYEIIEENVKLSKRKIVGRVKKIVSIFSIFRIGQDVEQMKIHYGGKLEIHEA